MFTSPLSTCIPSVLVWLWAMCIFPAIFRRSGFLRWFSISLWAQSLELGILFSWKPKQKHTLGSPRRVYILPNSITYDPSLIDIYQLGCFTSSAYRVSEYKNICLQVCAQYIYFHVPEMLHWPCLPWNHRFACHKCSD